MSDLSMTDRWVAEGLGDTTWSRRDYVALRTGSKWHTATHDQTATSCGKQIREGATWLRNVSLLDAAFNRCRTCLGGDENSRERHRRAYDMFAAADTIRDPASTVAELRAAGAEAMLALTDLPLVDAWSARVAAQCRAALAAAHRNRPGWAVREALLDRLDRLAMPAPLTVQIARHVTGPEMSWRGLLVANRGRLRDPHDTSSFDGIVPVYAADTSAEVRAWFDVLCATGDDLMVVELRGRQDQWLRGPKMSARFSQYVCFNWTGDQNRWILEVPEFVGDVVHRDGGHVLGRSDGYGERLGDVAELYWELRLAADDSDRSGLWATAARIA